MLKTLNLAADSGPYESLMVPSREECLDLMAEFGMLPHIREHSFLVLDVARRLGEGLAAAGLPLNLPLLEAGAILHDLGKTPCLGTPENHAEWGARALAGRGYPEVAQIVREHVRPQENAADPRPLREAEVVNYADKRVLHTQVVTLAERFSDLRVRYGRTPEALARISLLETRSQDLEARLFGYLTLRPDDLLTLNRMGR